MPIKAGTRVTGGKGIDRYVRQQKRGALHQPSIEIGFFDARISVLAARHEFGDPASNLPERPAFRLGIPAMIKAVRPVRDAGLRETGGVLTPALAHKLAILARDTIREAYQNFHGAPLSERQRLRKAGTGFEDDQLIGGEGPKMIGHITAYVDGQQV